MFGYSLPEWLLIFYLYCFLGWCFETTYVSLRTGHRVNRGFMKAPMLPLYGSGALLLLVIGRLFAGNILLTYVAGCIGAMLLELFTGMIMEWLFKIKYWDYSRQKIQYKGHICLSSTLVWGLLGLLVNGVIHKPVERLVLSLPETVAWGLALGLTIWLTVDFVQSFQAAWKLRGLLINLEQVRDDVLEKHREIACLQGMGASREQSNLQLNHILQMQERAMESFLEELFDILDNIQAELTARYEVHLSTVKKRKDRHQRLG